MQSRNGTASEVLIYLMYICTMKPRQSKYNTPSNKLMSEKEIFLQQIHKLVTWLNTCQLPDVQAERDIPPQAFSESFVKWLAVRFRTKHGRKRGIKCQIGKTREEITLSLNTTPEMWIVGLDTSRMCLHEVVSSRTSRLLLIEMSDSTACHPPVQNRTYYDERGVFNIEFVCEKNNSGAGGHQAIHLTNVGQATIYGRIGSKCVWGGINLDGESVDPQDLDDDMRSYNDEFCNGYGIPSTRMCGIFDSKMYSDYFAIHGENDQLLMIVHRIDATMKSQIVAAESYKERDPVGFALRKAACRARLSQYFGIEHH